MPLRPPEFEIDPDNPFERDTLGRQRRVEALCNLIRDEETAAVVSVDGGFGTGKSAFLKMCAAWLREAEIEVVEFNAWQQSHTGDPLMDLVSALASALSARVQELKKIALALAQRFTMNALDQVVAAATAGQVDLGKLVSAGGGDPYGRFAAWSEADNNVASFKKALAKSVSSSGGRLVLLVDELDRCMPSYAIELLNTARHLFDVHGVVIVLGINRTELEHRVQTIYGQSCDAETYLRRFVDLAISLGDPPAERILGYVAGVFAAAELDDNQTSDELEPALALFAQQPGASYRDIEQTAHHAAQIFSPAKGMPGWAWNRATIAMLLLRQIDRTLYEDFRAGRSDAFVVVKSLRSTIAPTPGAADARPRDLTRLEIMLLCLGEAHDFGSDEEEDFTRKYRQAGLGDDSDADDCLRELAGFEKRLAGHRISLERIADRIELVI